MPSGRLSKTGGARGKGGVSPGLHARSAVGMAELPFDIPVEVEAEIELRDDGPLG